MTVLAAAQLFLLPAVAASSVLARTSTICPSLAESEASNVYHADTSCDRAAYNQYKLSLNRHIQYESFKAIGGMSSVPDQKTVQCPIGGARVALDGPSPESSAAPMVVGMDTVFFVQNKASTPVVVAYLDRSTDTEVSAKNPKIFPAVADPAAILAPGSWMAVYAHEGHEFVVRQVKTANAVLGALVAGNVLMQHRAGLIPIGGSSSGSAAWTCPSVDVEPKAENNITAPAFARVPPAVMRPCHTMDVGFRNLSPCPLHGYFVTSEPEPSSASTNQKEETGAQGSNASTTSASTSSCTEHFRLHLGVQPVTNDYFNDWVSNTKFEGTFVGHTYHFRLAANPSILVERVTLAPITVTDCPDDNTNANSAAAQVSVADAIQIPNFLDSNEDSATNGTAVAWETTSLQPVDRKIYAALLVNGSSSTATASI